MFIYFVWLVSSCPSSHVWALLRHLLPYDRPEPYPYDQGSRPAFSKAFRILSFVKDVGQATANKLRGSLFVIFDPVLRLLLPLLKFTAISLRQRGKYYNIKRQKCMSRMGMEAY